VPLFVYDCRGPDCFARDDRSRNLMARKRIVIRSLSAWLDARCRPRDNTTTTAPVSIRSRFEGADPAKGWPFEANAMVKTRD
jgi:hypothetical protein